MNAQEQAYKIRFCGIDVYFTKNLDGGGMRFGQDYLRIVPCLPKRPRVVFEWCSGPGFIGFSLLAHGLCDRLCLADVNPLAVAACRKTIEANNLQDRVALYESDCLDAIPASERWDLVVGNPPHSGTSDLIRGWSPNTLTYMDPAWTLHRRFYRDVRKFLSPNGIVLIQENNLLSKVSDFASMIEENGMRIVYVCAPPPPYINEPIYYIGSVRAEEWAAGLGIGFASPLPPA